MAQETQYCNLRYIFGTAYSAKTEASEISPVINMCEPLFPSGLSLVLPRLHLRTAADSTMLRIVNLLIALSFGVHLEQFEHLTGLT